MISARQMIDEVSTYLVDQDPDAPFEHWSEDDLLSYFRLAVEIIASTQKDKFNKRVTLPLVAGMLQTTPERCRDMTRVLGQADAAGMITSFPRRASMDGLHLRGKVGCPDCYANVSAGNYKVESWYYDEADPHTLYVEPPVPAGANATLEIVCFVPPVVDNADSMVDLGAQLRPAIFELMLYYAYGVDTESVPSRDRSAAHLNSAFTLLGIDQRSMANRYASTRLPEARLGATK